MRTWLIAAGAAALGAGAGSFVTWRLVAADAAVTSAPALPPAMRQESSPANAAPLAGTGPAVAVQSRRDISAAESADPSPGVVDPPPTPEQSVAGTRAHAVVEAAISRGQWTTADADALREQFDSLTPADRQAVLGKFAVAINTGRLIPQMERIPF